MFKVDITIGNPHAPAAIMVIPSPSRVPQESGVYWLIARRTVRSGSKALTEDVDGCDCLGWYDAQL